MYFTYVIRSLNRNYIYVGLSKIVVRRVNEHNKGKEKTTRPYAPFELILVDGFETRELALKREKYLKSGMGKEMLKAIPRNI